jgi:hypothetical protein
MAYPTRDPEKESFWRWVIELHAESRLTAKEFCEREGLSVASFYSWRRTLRERDKATVQQPAKRGGKKSVNGRSPGRATKASNTKRPASSANEKSPAAATLVPLEVISDLGQLLEIVHPRGHVVRVPAAFSTVALRDVLALLDGDQASTD